MLGSLRLIQFFLLDQRDFETLILCSLNNYYIKLFSANSLSHYGMVGSGTPFTLFCFFLII